MVFEKAGTGGRTSLILKPREVQKHRNQPEVVKNQIK
jgi:hypothetical protein